jgi:Pyruvate/2-oxoacid:ferredoxin oxidoreductase gamma subunit
LKIIVSGRIFMAYKVGISSGWWKIGKDPNLLGLAIKAGQFGATAGVQFNQVDLDTILEFIEPDMKLFMKRYKKELGIEVGLHGEIQPAPVQLESAERREWDQSHDRTVVTIRGCADLGFVYLNIHTSNKIQLIQEERQLRPFGHTYQVVDFKGRPFWELAEEKNEGGKAVKNFIIRMFEKGAGGINREIASEEFFKNRFDAYQKNLNNDILQEALRRIRQLGQPQTEDVIDGAFRRVVREWQDNGIIRTREAEFYYGCWKDSRFAKYLLDTGEIDGYIAVATYMIATNDPLWNIVGPAEGSTPHEKAEDAYVNRHELFNAAVAMKYLEGHLTTNEKSENKKLLEGKSILEFCNEKKVYVLLETPHSSEGNEGLWRLYHPLHYQHLIRKLNSPYLRITIDFEQVMGQRIDIDEDLIKKMPPDFGKLIYLLHLGEPVPYHGTAHIPIAIGGHGMHILYRWIYALRKAGFKDGIFIFERGSGRRPGEGNQPGVVFEESVRAVRQVIKYLEQETKPQELPPEFFGISVENPEVFARQRVIMREHAWDPLEGLLIQPEEKHGFFSRAAVEKGKGEIWEKRKYR